MRGTALLVGCLWAAACAHPEPQVLRDAIKLPVVPHAVDAAIRGGEVIRVTRDGRILVRGEARSINGLQEIVEDPSRPPRVEADRDAPWMHVQWVMAALGELGYESVQCVVDIADSDERSALSVPVYRGLWEDKWPPATVFDLDGFATISSVWVRPSEGTPGKAEYHLDALASPSEVTRDAARVGAWATSFLDNLDPEQRARMMLAIEASGTVPYHNVIAAFAAVQASGATRVDVGLEALHPWDRDRKILPSPVSGFPILRWMVDLTWKPLVPMNLPAASMSEADRDDDPDDRLIVNLTATGRLMCANKTLTLEEFGDYLHQKADAYDRKRQAVGRKGRVEGGPDRRLWSTLYVLLRVDRNAPWEHVRWLLAELSQHRFFKIQFAAQKDLLPEYSQEELERLWAGRDIYGPLSLERKLQCLLATSDETEAVHIEVRIHGSPTSYEFGDKSTRSPAELANWLREAPRAPHRKTLGLIAADARTRFGEVIAAINSFSMAGLEKIDFAGVERAPHGVYRMKRLPPPE